MIKESITIKDVLDVLNRAVKANRVAVTRLCDYRTPCNDALKDDPTIQVLDLNGVKCVGFLGMLNGLFGVDDEGWGTIAAEYDVVCPSCEYEPTGDDKEGDACQFCASKLVTGDIREFVDIGRR